MAQFTHGSLFDGSGGMRIGFEQAGFQTIWEVELTRGRDVRTIDVAELAKPLVISGGPPCQKTSRAAALHRTRTGATLWPDMLRIVTALLPEWVVVEQPKGGQAVIVQASQALQRLGYGSAGRIIDSRHWLPQQRTRWFLVGRMGATGLDVWNHFYPHCERVERGELYRGSTEERTVQGQTENQGVSFDGNCPDCVRGGILTRISARKPALIGAGNAVSIPVARFLANRIHSALERGL